MSLENAPVHCSASPVTKKDPGLAGPDTSWRTIFQEKEHKMMKTKLGTGVAVYLK